VKALKKLNKKKVKNMIIKYMEKLFRNIQTVVYPRYRAVINQKLFDLQSVISNLKIQKPKISFNFRFNVAYPKPSELKAKLDLAMVKRLLSEAGVSEEKTSEFLTSYVAGGSKTENHVELFPANSSIKESTKIFLVSRENLVWDLNNAAPSEAKLAYKTFGFSRFGIIPPANEDGCWSWDPSQFKVSPSIDHKAKFVNAVVDAGYERAGKEVIIIFFGVGCTILGSAMTILVDQNESEPASRKISNSLEDDSSVGGRGYR